MQYSRENLVGRVIRWVEVHTTAVYTFLLFILGSIVFGFQYWQPTSTQWDEVYYIPVVARYETSTFFMESHPPLGKLLLTAGDVLWGVNKDIDKSSIIQYDTINNGDEVKVNDLPPNYNFIGIRFFPVLAAVLIPLLVMAIITQLTGKDWLGFAVGMITVLDTALALHFRSAMLDSILIALMLCSLYFALGGIKQYVESKKVSTSKLIWTAIFAGLAISTKYNAVITLAPLFFLCILQAKPLITKNKTWLGLIDRALYRTAGAWTRFVALLALIGIVFVAIWTVHFGIARTYNAKLVNNQGLFLANDYLSTQLKEKGSIQNFRMVAAAITSGIHFTLSYHAGVPGFQSCEQEAKIKNEVCNGSLPWMWVIGARTINFRYSKWAQEKNGANSLSLERYAALQRGEDTEVKNESELEKNTKSAERKKLAEQYIPTGIWYTLVGNPAVWFLSLVGVCMGIWILLQTLLGLLKRRKVKLSTLSASILALTLVWLGYMTIALQSSRILYLYHYFFTLIVGLLLLGLVTAYYRIDHMKHFQTILGCVLSAVILAFLFFAPFAYGIPMSYDSFDWRNWLVPWALKK